MVRGDRDRKFFKSTTGLLQGESTSPMLFSIFINDLEQNISNLQTGVNIQDYIIKILMFADDIALFSETQEGLQAGLKDLENYCLKWGLTVNVAKTKVVVFRKAGRLRDNEIWTYGGRNLEVVQNFKYLGCVLSSGGSLTGGTKELLNSARRALFSLRRFYSKNPQTLPKTKLELFMSMIKPILFYGSEVWGLRKADPIEKFFLAYLKSILGVKGTTTNSYVYGEFGTYPLYIQRRVVVMKYWLKILDMIEEGDTLTSKIYRELHQLSTTNPNKVTWVTLLRDMLNRCGMGNVWLAQKVDDKKSFLVLFKQRVYDIFIQEWRAEIENSTDGRLYKHIKVNFEFEEYLNLENSSLRTAISRIRLSSHVFRIERGRWGQNHIARQDRKCEICDTIEDEFHCLIECVRFVEERKGCLTEELKRRKSMYEFVNFFQSKNIGVIKKLGMLCSRVQIAYKELM